MKIPNSTSLTFVLASCALLLASGVSVHGQSYPNERYWSSPEFINRFMATYGAIAALEPRVSNEEQEFIRPLIAQMRTDTAAAATALRAGITPESTAFFDFTLGNLYFQLGRNQDALASYRNAIRKFPDYLRAHKNLGILLVKMENFDEARPPLTKTIELGGGDSVTFGLLGYCYLMAEQLLSAEAAFRNAMIYEPERTDWKLGLARSVLQQQRFNEAALLLDELLVVDPDDASLWVYQANAFLGLNRHTRAAANFEVARRLGQATAESLIILGDIYANQGALDLASAAYLDAIARNPDQPIERPIRTAEIVVRRGAWDEAAEIIASIRQTYGGRIDAYSSLKLLQLEAKITVATKDDEEAIAILREVISKNPLDSEALILLARAQARMGKHEYAEFLFERAARIRGFEADAMVEHAQMLVELRRYVRAASLLERAQNIRPKESVGRYLEQVRMAARSASL